MGLEGLENIEEELEQITPTEAGVVGETQLRALDDDLTQLSLDFQQAQEEVLEKRTETNLLDDETQREDLNVQEVGIAETQRAESFREETALEHRRDHILEDVVDMRREKVKFLRKSEARLLEEARTIRTRKRAKWVKILEKAEAALEGKRTELRRNPSDAQKQRVVRVLEGYVAKVEERIMLLLGRAEEKITLARMRSQQANTLEVNIGRVPSPPVQPPPAQNPLGLLFPSTAPTPSSTPSRGRREVITIEDSPPASPLVSQTDREEQQHSQERMHLLSEMMEQLSQQYEQATQVVEQARERTNLLEEAASAASSQQEVAVVEKQMEVAVQRERILQSERVGIAGRADTLRAATVKQLQTDRHTLLEEAEKMRAKKPKLVKRRNELRKALDAAEKTVDTGKIAKLKRKLEKKDKRIKEIGRLSKNKVGAARKKFLRIQKLQQQAGTPPVPPSPPAPPSPSTTTSTSSIEGGMSMLEILSGRAAPVPTTTASSRRRVIAPTLVAPITSPPLRVIPPTPEAPTLLEEELSLGTEDTDEEEEEEEGSPQSDVPYVYSEPTGLGALMALPSPGEGEEEGPDEWFDLAERYEGQMNAYDQIMRIDLEEFKRTLGSGFDAPPSPSRRPASIEAAAVMQKTFQSMSILSQRLTSEHYGTLPYYMAANRESDAMLNEIRHSEGLLGGDADDRAKIQALRREMGKIQARLLLLPLEGGEAQRTKMNKAIDDKTRSIEHLERSIGARDERRRKLERRKEKAIEEEKRDVQRQEEARLRDEPLSGSFIEEEEEGEGSMQDFLLPQEEDPELERKIKEARAPIEARRVAIREKRLAEKKRLKEGKDSDMDIGMRYGRELTV